MGQRKSKQDSTPKPAVVDEQANPDREQWGSRTEFILSAIAYAVGIGNIWRFPSKVHEFGGAAFVYVYVITQILLVVPLFYMETALGQFSSQGPITVWNAVPLFKGIGWATIVAVSMTVCYYNMIIAYTLHYLFSSFNSVLPWQDCRPEWVAQYGCTERGTSKIENSEFCNLMVANNKTDHEDFAYNCRIRTSASELYWELDVLDVSSGLTEGTGDINYKLALLLLLAWIIAFLAVVKGIKSSGKIVYVTATFPYVILTILLGRSASLEGAIDGLRYYMIPRWEALLNLNLWTNAAQQGLLSMGIGFGGMITMASYNRFHHNIARDTILISFVNAATSIYAGFLFFTALGHMAHSTGIPIEKVAHAGPGFLFVTIPEVISMMPVPPLWSILFWLMVLMLGVDTVFSQLETVVTALSDEFLIKQYKHGRIILSACIVIVLFLCGLPQCSRAGIYVTTIFDNYSSGVAVQITVLLEVIAIAWVYGIRRFGDDVKMMLGSRPNPFLLATWTVTAPIILLLLIVFSFVTLDGPQYAGYTFPRWVHALTISIIVLRVSIIPLTAFSQYFQRSKFVKTSKRLLSATPDWGPSDPNDRLQRYANTQAGAVTRHESSDSDDDYPMPYKRKHLESTVSTNTTNGTVNVILP